MDEQFSIWINRHLEKELPQNIKAMNFNIYEGKDSYHIQLIGASIFDESDEDWACEEVFTTGEDIFEISKMKAGENWEEALEYIKVMIKEYITNGKYALLLHEYEAIGIGFVDGDIEIINRNNR